MSMIYLCLAILASATESRMALKYETPGTATCPMLFGRMPMTDEQMAYWHGLRDGILQGDDLAQRLPHLAELRISVNAYDSLDFIHFEDVMRRTRPEIRVVRGLE